MNTALRDQLQALGYKEICNHGNKVGQPSYGKAEAMMRSILKEQERKPDRKPLRALNVYFCPRCKLYYVGHDRKRFA